MYLEFSKDNAEKFIQNSKEVDLQYIEACEWLNSLGVDYRRTRFGDYVKDIESILSSSDTHDSEKQLRYLLNAQLEATELIRIKTAFESFEADGLIENIKKIAKGQRFRSQKDQSRDFAFELSIASRFVRAGFDVNLKSITDLVATINGRKLYVECKRLKSYSKLNKRVKEANKQIKKRLQNDKSFDSRGIIALNITDIITAPPIVVAPSITVYRRASTETLKSFVMGNQCIWANNRHKRCLGALTDFSTQGIISNDDSDEITYINVREANVFQYKISSDDEAFLESFRSNLGNQNIS